MSRHLQIEQAKATLKAAMLGMLAAHAPSDGNDVIPDRMIASLSIDAEEEIDGQYDLSITTKSGEFPLVGGSL
ncbi:MAG: hypothetical protein V4646_10865 [Pseudomonadota bacterium]